MLLWNARAGRLPLALSVAVLAALTACTDEPVGPKPPAAAKPSVRPAGGEPVQLTVTNASGGTEVGSIRWAASQIRTSEGGYIRFDPSLAGDTITLGAELSLDYNTTIEGPAKGITLSGNDQHRVIRAPTNVALQNVTVTKGNHASGSAMWVGGQLKLLQSTVQDNRGSGPVIDTEAWGVAITNSTISRNVGSAALQYEDGTHVTLTHSTIAFNTGAGLRYEPGPEPFTKVQLFNSILANNGVNCTDYWLFEYYGRNISSDWSCGEVAIVVGDPQLMPLANNGGPTMTHAIPHTSPAFNKGADCFMLEDQRYVPRDSKCDVGAFEFNEFTKVTLTLDNAVKVNASTGKALLTGTIKCTRADAFRLALELHQDQKVNGQIVDVHSATDIPVACTTTAKPWSATMALLPGEAFQTGAARATAQPFHTPEWLTPANAASGVRISVPRKLSGL